MRKPKGLTIGFLVVGILLGWGGYMVGHSRGRVETEARLRQQLRQDLREEVVQEVEIEVRTGRVKQNMIYLAQLDSGNLS